MSPRKRKPHLRNCIHQTDIWTFLRALTWLMINAGRSSSLWVVPVHHPCTGDPGFWKEASWVSQGESNQTVILHAFCFSSCLESLSWLPFNDRLWSGHVCQINTFFPKFLSVINLSILRVPPYDPPQLSTHVFRTSYSWYLCVLLFHSRALPSLLPLHFPCFIICPGYRLRPKDLEH